MLNYLPKEIFLLIFEKVPLKYIGLASAACKAWCRLIYETDAIWKPKFEQLYGGPISTEETNR